MTLTDLQSQGVLELLDVELARALGRMVREPRPELELAIALASRNVRCGHACFPLDLPTHRIWTADAEVTSSLPDRAEWEKVLRQSTLTQGGPLVLDDKRRLYLRRYWELEREIAVELAARAKRSPFFTIDEAWLRSALDRLLTTDETAPQRRAAQKALRHRVSLLCGGPGTGKTTTVAAIVALLIEARLRHTQKTPEVQLLAPTGKSAARLSEAVTRSKAGISASRDVLRAIPEEATTVQRALRMRRRGMRFGRDADLPLEADIVVLDEASMIDLTLMRQLLAATQPDATLLMVGDPDQLTSVEAGSVLRDLVAANHETWWHDRVTHLTKTYRYDQDQPLGQLVSAIRQGDAGAVDRLLDDGEAADVAWNALDELSDELERAAGRWAEISSASNPDEHFAMRGRYVVLSPFRRGLIGTHRLGAAIQQRLGEDDVAATPIIIEENNYELRVYNGDFGMLVAGNAASTAIIQREADQLRVAEARLPPHSQAFALTVHKAQGSEFDEVLVVLPEEDTPLLTRELLYTAVSRAKKRVRLVGPKDVIKAAIGRRAQRFSGLVDAIHDAAS